MSYERFEPVFDLDYTLEYIIDKETGENVDPADFFNLVNEIAKEHKIFRN